MFLQHSCWRSFAIFPVSHLGAVGRLEHLLTCLASLVVLAIRPTARPLTGLLQPAVNAQVACLALACATSSFVVCRYRRCIRRPTHCAYKNALIPCYLSQQPAASHRSTPTLNPLKLNHHSNQTCSSLYVPSSWPSSPPPSPLAYSQLHRPLRKAFPSAANATACPSVLKSPVMPHATGAAPASACRSRLSRALRT